MVKLITRIALTALLATGFLNACNEPKPAASPPPSPGAASVKSQAGPVISTRDGAVRGLALENILVFKGIPYARPPVGALRWRRAQPPARWPGILPAQEFGPSCLQKKRPARPVGRQSEDCLTLNIWAPKNLKVKKPVMVWIHGGAFRFGSGSQGYYDGTQFARSGVVLVTINYRLGRFGFFSHPALDGQGETVNFGLGDQIEALKWVRRNIAAFGGDPGNVTIFGESSGAVSVGYHLTMTASRGLFHRAIMQSGGGWQIAGRVKKRRGRIEALQTKGIAWAKRHGLGPDATAAELRAVPAAAVLEADRSQGGMGAVNPVIDGVLVEDDIARRYADGKAAPVPVMTGSNSFEGSLLALFRIRPKLILYGLGQRKAEARQLYQTRQRGLSDTEFAYELFADAAFAAPARDIARLAMAGGHKAYVYYFDYRRTAGTATSDGAHHGWEIPFVFNNLGSSRALFARNTNRAAARRLASTMHQYWVTFATSGAPGSGKMAPWPPILDGGAENTLVFRNDGSHSVPDFRKARLDFQRELYLKRRQRMAR